MEVFIFLIVLILYFLPTFLGNSKRNAGSIFILNLLLGWTFIGWIVALVWAVSKDSEPQQIIIHQTKEKDEKKWTKEELQNMLDKMNDKE